MASKIHTWNEIKEKYSESIILGNGSSIAVNHRFQYASLFEKATELNFINTSLSALFESFETNDFEAIMHKLLQAEKVNESLSVNNRSIQDAYQTCRKSLIEVIRHIHPSYNEIKLEDLYSIASFLKNFKKVITLNYDLIIYWAMYCGNQEIYDDEGDCVEHGNVFKDGFIERSNGDRYFNPDWEFLSKPHGNRENSTLVFYLHGNLSLANIILNNLYEIDVKMVSADAVLLDVIFEKWNSGDYSPLFVCEGESKRKLSAIKSSNYLSTVYYDVLSHLGPSIAIYGFSFGNQDEHIISRLREVSSRHSPIQNIAVSVHVDGSENDYIKRVNDIVETRIGRNINIEFYDAKSKGCWNND